MQSDSEFDAVGRIIIAVKGYRHLVKCGRILAGTATMNAYLKQQLSGYDWNLWQQVSGEQPGPVSHPYDMAYA